jgi:predicted transcriptional regulator
VKEHLSTRLDPGTKERLDKLAALMVPCGTDPNRSLVIRACVLVGLDVLEKQYAKETT